MKEYVCECGRIFTTPQSYSGHRTRCETNPNNHRVFIIVDDSIIVEIKGFETDLDRVKYTLVPELVVLRYADIKHCIEYVQSKYNVSELSELYAAV